MKQYKNKATVIRDPLEDGDNIPNIAKTKDKLMETVWSEINMAVIASPIVTSAMPKICKPEPTKDVSSFEFCGGLKTSP